ncbi:Phosphoglycerol transferase MdoB [Oceanospirillum multiglobuliferum]|nr:Phosphoglycerol transferase MdoB [Oceanospirillum multiglobuliferum]
MLLYTPEVATGLSSSEITHALLWGLRFDLAIVGVLSFFNLLTAYLFGFGKGPRTIKWLLPAITLLVMLQLGDMAYFKDAGRHISYESKDFFATPISLISQGIGQLGWLVLVLPITLLIFSRIPFKLGRFNKPYSWAKVLFLFPSQIFITLLVAAIMARGGVKGLPLDPASAYNIGDVRLAPIALNGAYSALYGLLRSNDGIQASSIAAPENREQLVRSLYMPKEQPLENTNLEQFNLVFVLLESWPIVRMTTESGEQVTPVFSALQAQSLSAETMIASGHRTTEGIYSIFCSGQNPLGKTIAKTQLQNMPYGCLPQLLREQGWSSAFFQGSYKNTSGTGAFAQTTGFEHSYGKEDISSDQAQYEQNSWGYYDQDLYRFVVNSIESLPEPFIIGINTNTTHDLKLPKGVEARFGFETEQQKEFSVLSFADSAIAGFMAQMQSKTLDKPIAYIFVADHTAGLIDSRLNHYRIPFAIYVPGFIQPKLIHDAVSQRDLAPTIAHLIGLDAPWFSGQNLISIANNEASAFADYYHGGVVGWIEGDWLVEQSTQGDGVRCYNWRLDPKQTQEIACSEPTENMRQRALAFTAVQQQLLFEGKTKQFMDYKP